MTRRQRDQSGARVAAAFNLGDLDGRGRRDLDLAYDQPVVALAIIGTRVVVAAQLAGAVRMFIISTFKLIFNVQLVTVLRCRHGRVGRQTIGARRQRDLLGARNVRVGLALDLAGGELLDGLRHLALAVKLGARLLTSRSGWKQTFTYLKGSAERFSG